MASHTQKLLSLATFTWNYSCKKVKERAGGWPITTRAKGPETNQQTLGSYNGFDTEAQTQSDSVYWESI